MKQVFLWSIGLALAVYTILTVFMGSSGLDIYMHAQQQRTLMQENLTVLEQQNATLLQDLHALQSLPEQSLVQARELGFVHVRDVVVRVDFSTNRATSRSPVGFQAGTVLCYEKGRFLDDSRIKQYSVLLAGLFCLGGLLVVLVRMQRRKVQKAQKKAGSVQA